VRNATEYKYESSVILVMIQAFPFAFAYFNEKYAIAYIKNIRDLVY